MLSRKMKPIVAAVGAAFVASMKMHSTTMLAALAMLGVAANANESAADVADVADVADEEESASVLGFQAGDHVHQNIRREADAHVSRARREAYYSYHPNKWGFDRVSVSYTDKQGVCSVTGYLLAEGQGSGELSGDELVERVEKKMGRPPSRSNKEIARRPIQMGEESIPILMAWEGAEANPFEYVALHEFDDGGWRATFNFKNHRECVAEQNAVDAEWDAMSAKERSTLVSRKSDEQAAKEQFAACWMVGEIADVNIGVARITSKAFRASANDLEDLTSVWVEHVREHINEWREYVPDLDIKMFGYKCVLGEKRLQAKANAIREAKENITAMKRRVPGIEEGADTCDHDFPY